MFFRCFFPVVLGALCAVPALAEDPPLALWGGAGLIDMPSGQAPDRDRLTFSNTFIGGQSQTTIGFQAFDWLGGAFRSGAEPVLDLRFRLLEETDTLPGVSLGLNDVLGPGDQAGEWIAATRGFGAFQVTGGLGWGRFASEGALGAPFGDRPAAGPGPQPETWFRGDVAAFAGVDWAVSDRWHLKAEWSSDAFAAEEAAGDFTNRSPFNLGLEFHHSPMLTFGAYALHGAEIGLAAHVILDPSQRPSGNVGGTGPAPVKPRPPRSVDPDAWSPEWVSQPGVTDLLLQNLDTHVERSGLDVEALQVTGTTAQVRFRLGTLDAEAQGVGRMARAMTHILPASVEVFEIVPVVNGIPASKVILRRSDVEALEFAPDGAAALRSRAQIADAGPLAGDAARNPDLYPDFSYSLGPYLRFRFLDASSPLTADTGLRLGASYQFAPGLTVEGAVTKRVWSNLAASSAGVAGLPPVRSDAQAYFDNGDPALETATLTWNGRVGRDLYGRVSVGYLEQMFGGVAGEVLYMPAGRPWALGVEVDAVAQRDTDGGIGFDEFDYQVLSGHVSGYYDLGQGYQAQLDVGRYLAGDLGGTLTVTRRFENGWKLSAWVTGSEATDNPLQGIRMEVPVSWFTGQPNRATRPLEFQPFESDAGARLRLDGRLFDQLTDYSDQGLDEQWGRFWK